MLRIFAAVELTRRNLSAAADCAEPMLFWSDRSLGSFDAWGTQGWSFPPTGSTANCPALARNSTPNSPMIPRARARKGWTVDVRLQSVWRSLALALSQPQPAPATIPEPLAIGFHSALIDIEVSAKCRCGFTIQD
jgi:hypothetical protein